MNRHEQETLAAIRANMESVCGPEAEYSDYRPGETIAYRVSPSEIRTGVILFITPPTMLQGQHIPLTYLCHSGASGDSWPDYVYVTDILNEALSD